MRGERPFVFTNLREGAGLQQIIDFILHRACWKMPENPLEMGYRLQYAAN